jgi:hypothetical protein
MSTRREDPPRDALLQGSLDLANLKGVSKLIYTSLVHASTTRRMRRYCSEDHWLLLSLSIHGAVRCRLSSILKLDPRADSTVAPYQ